jgi:hypothetical protein
MLREAYTERNRLNEQLSQQEELQNPIVAPTQESNELNEGEGGQLVLIPILLVYTVAKMLLRLF